MKLIYCAYSIIDQPEVPEWIEKFITNPMVRREGWAVYNPINGFRGNFTHNLAMAAAIGAQNRLSPTAVANARALKLDPQLLRPMSEVMARIQATDEVPTIDITFKDLYVILRSDIILVDLNAAGHGEKSQEVLYAYLCNIPVVGIAHRFILSPWMADKVSAVIFPRTSDEIVQQVLAHDHKTTAMLEYYRALEGEITGTNKSIEETQQKIASVESAAGTEDVTTSTGSPGVYVTEPEEDADGGRSPDKPVTSTVL